ncbi:hypothetical protein LH464_06985 [Neorhizobium sp. T786]|uniref:ImuA family protein n=1 Tax=Pseudorhizobium xiangyangii TaxID=2883104 RepID=UPI001CFF8A64|nr:hypothetical protein [Neorhizobium xiangyangii]MCB5202222.1 hypothetical protein [Neorhizobium xiangyangii]
MAKYAAAQERLFALRETIAKLEGRSPALVVEGQPWAGKGSVSRTFPRRVFFGVPEVDAALDEGIPLDGITEIRTLSMRDAGAGSGFALALAAVIQKAAEASALLWISDRVSSGEAGLPYPIGLTQYGLGVEDFLHAVPRKLDDALWLAEAAASSGALAATILEIKGNPSSFGLSESRRLNLRAKAAGRPILLLRHAGEEEASSAVFRFCVEPRPASERPLPDGSMLGGSIGSSVFRLTLEKSRNPAPISFILEWNSHDRQFSLTRQSELSRLSGRAAARSGALFPASGDRSDRASALGRLLAFGRAS